MLLLGMQLNKFVLHILNFQYSIQILKFLSTYHEVEVSIDAQVLKYCQYLKRKHFRNQ